MNFANPARTLRVVDERFEAMDKLIAIAREAGILVKATPRRGCVTRGRIMGLSAIQIAILDEPSIMTKWTGPMMPTQVRGTIVSFAAIPVPQKVGWYAYLTSRGRT